MDSFLKRFTITRKESLPKSIQLRFLKRLSRLLSNGYPLLEALENIQWDKELREIAIKITSFLEDGYTIDQALEKVSFHQTIISYLYFIRANGDLQGSIEKCVELFENQMKHSKKLQQITRYPTILLVVFSIMLYFINQSVLPSFQKLFPANSEAANVVNMSMGIIQFLGILLFVLLTVIVVLLIVWHLTKHSMPIEKQLKMYQAIPIYRNFLKAQTSFQFATHFSTLLKTGIPFKEILQQMKSQTKLPIISYYSELMIEELTRGFHITSLLTQFIFLEKQLAAIFQKNVDVDALEKDLTVYAEIILEEIERKLIKFITYLQPVFFILLAGLIIFIYVTLMWPMFQMIKTI